MIPHIAKMPGGWWGVWRSKGDRLAFVRHHNAGGLYWPAAVGLDMQAAFKLSLVVLADNRRGQ